MPSSKLAVLFPKPDPTLTSARSFLAERLAEHADASAAPPRIWAALVRLNEVASGFTKLLSASAAELGDQIAALAEWALDPPATAPEPFRYTGPDRREELDRAGSQASLANHARAKLEGDLTLAERRVQATAADVEAALTGVVLEEMHRLADRITRDQARGRSDAQRLASLAGYADGLAAKGIAAGSPSGRSNQALAKQLGFVAYDIRQPKHIDLLPVSEFAAAQQDIDNFMGRLRADVKAQFQEEE